MRIIDLSHILHDHTPVYPGTEPPSFKNACTMDKDQFREKLITMYSHTGTHLDVPAHMEDKGATIDELPLDLFVGKGTVIDVRDEKHISLDILLSHEDKIKSCDFILFLTGWDKYWGMDEYYQDFPTLTKDAIAWLVEQNIKGIGVDAISIDPIDTNDFAIHQTLLTKNRLSIENLCHLDQLIDHDFIFHAAPLKISDGDGSPIRAYGVMMNF